MERTTIALFGEAERGEYRTPHFLRSLDELAEKLGQPPSDSQGLFLAIQTLLYDYDLLYFRVEAEGYSISDYMQGFTQLKQANHLNAICLPGVGDGEIIDASTRICLHKQTILLLTEADLYDYLTDS